MSRKTGRRRGRPRKPDKKPRPTTRAGRRGEEFIDAGTIELQRLRLQATGHVDLPVDPLGVLLGRGLIDKTQYGAGRDLGELIEIARRGLGLPDAGCHASWLAILAGGRTGGRAGADSSAAAEWAARILARIARSIGDPGLITLTLAVAEGYWPPHSAVAQLRLGLDRVARIWAREREAAKAV
jgi:hypothetical protein